MHRFADGVVSAKRKRNVAYAAADARARKILFDPARRFDEIDRVIAMFFEPGGDGQNVRIENNVARREACLLGQEIVGARADLDFALQTIGLTLLIERHHDRGSAISPD